MTVGVLDSDPFTLIPRRENKPTDKMYCMLLILLEITKCGVWLIPFHLHLQIQYCFFFFWVCGRIACYFIDVSATTMEWNNRDYLEGVALMNIKVVVYVL